MNTKKQKEKIDRILQMLTELGIYNEFYDGLMIDEEMQKNNIGSDVAWSVLENRLHELGFKVDASTGEIQKPLNK